MRYDTALNFYKTGKAIAKALGIKHQAVYQWKRKGVVPPKKAAQLEAHSKGKVRFDPKVYGISATKSGT